MSPIPGGDGSERDSGLAAVYRAAAPEAPPPALDAAIRAAARREVDARPRPVGRFFSRSWRVPLSVAAVIVLSVSLVTLMREEAPPEILQPPRADVPVARPEVLPGAPGGRDNKDVAPADGPRQTAKARRDIEGSASQPAEAAKPALSAERAAGAAVVAPAATSGQVAGATVEAKIEAKSEAASADSVVREPPRARMQAAPAPALQSAPLREDAIRLNVNLPPEKWLEQIEELRKQGRLEEAKTSFAEFRRRYPGYPLPAALKDGVKP